MQTLSFVVLALALGYSPVLAADGSQGGAIPRDYTCYDIYGNPYIKDIPHPSNCNHFLKCQETNDGPASVIFECGSNLHFSLESCRCERPGDAMCFELGNSDHEAIRMRCACPLIMGPGGSLVPDLTDKRCLNG